MLYYLQNVLLCQKKEGNALICTLCPRKCSVERSAQKHGFCGVGDALRVARIALHPWEEPPISGTRGSGTIFLCGCNLRCVFCQNREISHEMMGQEISEDALAAAMLSLRDEGAHNINLVTPTHYLPPLRRVLERVKPTLGIPVVWNCGGYEDAELLSTLDGLVDIYLPDVKYYASELSKTLSGVADYYPVALTALREMLRQQPTVRFDGDGMLQCGTVVRHLVLPGYRADSISLLEALARDVGSDRFLLSLMSQYTPEFAKNTPYKSLQRRLTDFEYRSVQERAVALGFDGFSQSRTSASASFTPAFSEKRQDAKPPSPPPSRTKGRSL